jgi:multisubunit Na+/H+ antiporter MnhB subunit
MTILTQKMSMLLLLPIWMIAFAILVKGYAETGDGFSAGVVAAVGVLLHYIALGYRRTAELVPVRAAPLLAFSGLLLALLVGFHSVLRGEPFFSHYPPPGGHVPTLGSLELHTAVLFDVGVFLIVVGFMVHSMSLIARHTAPTDEHVPGADADETDGGPR